MNDSPITNLRLPTNAGGSIVVHYDAEANEVTGIVGDRSALDDYGNKVGVSLLDANRTVNLRCESDEHVTCMSALIPYGRR
jgi:hypothetical protein